MVCARAGDGDFEHYGIIENSHTDHILDVSFAPAKVSEKVAANAVEISRNIAAAFEYVGTLCIEFFLTSDDKLLINELAPRPHNSGHLTFDACVTSQFEQQARVLAALPMGDTRQHTPAVMVNLLGDIWFDGEASAPREPDWPRALAHGLAKLHLYGKREPRRGRKMGHVTCLGDTLEAALATARAIKRDLGIPGAGEL